MKGSVQMNLKDAAEGKDYIIDNILTNDEELDTFLFSLGCYGGESIHVTSQLRNGCIVTIKNSRYHIDTPLAKTITIHEIKGEVTV